MMLRNLSVRPRASTQKTMSMANKELNLPTRGIRDGRGSDGRWERRQLAHLKALAAMVALRLALFETKNLTKSWLDGWARLRCSRRTALRMT